MVRFGLVGLGKMGANIARQAFSKGYGVVGYTLGSPPDDLQDYDFIATPDLRGMVQHLPKPRVILLYIPAGPAIDEAIKELSEVLSAGDIIADGGNSYWGDSIRRQESLREHDLFFVDVGTSGGPDGALTGACFMVGGEQTPVSQIAPLLKDLAVDGGFVHTGGPGTGHFTKLVHNGIEFGMLQAIGEGMALLEAYPQHLPVGEILNCWRHGSVVRSWLIEVMESVLRTRGTLSNVPSQVEDTGEVNWLISDAMALEVPVPIISGAVMQLISSRDGSKAAAKAVAMMRHGFGGHPYGLDSEIAHERHHSRVSGFPRKQMRLL